ncbi:MAG: DUF423 domain-containing protein [Acidobacteriota bacterium]|nr:DUF423 domain-containing protein [Blastocatellia bacterium]MDW8413469.1 DUF423 domain-containing protein [Acidobacteriota bacterium]
MMRIFLATGAISALLAVAAGAFGAHGLKNRLSSEMLAVFETAVRYQMYHSLALLACATLCERRPDNGYLAMAGWLFLFGITVFSGSLYGLSLTGVRWLGAITPIGGVAFLLGWALLALSAIKG